MKKFSMLFLLLTAITLSTLAQTESLIANYPLMSNTIDETGLNDDAFVRNAPFQNEAIYSNGIYYGDDTLGSQIHSPTIQNFDPDAFVVSLDFLVESHPAGKMPILIGGNSWRWIGAYIEDGRMAFMANDQADYNLTTTMVSLNEWHSLGLTYNKLSKQAKLFFDDELIYQLEMPFIEHNDDANFSNEHAGTGNTFLGYWKNLKVYNGSELSGIANEDIFSQIHILNKNDCIEISHNSSIGEMTVKLLNVNGQKLISTQVSSPLTKIQTTDFPSGIYLLSVETVHGIVGAKKLFLQ